LVIIIKTHKTKPVNRNIDEKISLKALDSIRLLIEVSSKLTKILLLSYLTFTDTTGFGLPQGLVLTVYPSAEAEVALSTSYTQHSVAKPSGEKEMRSLGHLTQRVRWGRSLILTVK